MSYGIYRRPMTTECKCEEMYSFEYSMNWVLFFMQTAFGSVLKFQNERNQFMHNKAYSPYSYYER